MPKDKKKTTKPKKRKATIAIIMSGPKPKKYKGSCK